MAITISSACTLRGHALCLAHSALTRVPLRRRLPWPPPLAHARPHARAHALHHHRPRQPEGRDLGLHRLGVHVLRVAHLDVPDLQGEARWSARSRTRRGPIPPTATCSSRSSNIPVTSASTFVLLMSSLAMVLALAAVENAASRATRGQCWATRSSGSRPRPRWARPSSASRRTSSPRSCTRGSRSTRNCSAPRSSRSPASTARTSRPACSGC